MRNLVATTFNLALVISLKLISVQCKSQGIFEELIGTTLYKWNSTTEVIEDYTRELLADKKIIGIYLSASWCGPCQRFTPELASFYKEVNKKGKKFEIVWVSQDRTTEAFQNYYVKMPWLAVTFANIQATLGHFANPKYGMRGIPHLIILDAEDGEIITTDGRGQVARDKYGLEFPWRKRSIFNIVPKPARKLFIRQLFKLASIGQRFFDGVMTSLTPTSVWAFLKERVFPNVYSLGKFIFLKGKAAVRN